MLRIFFGNDQIKVRQRAVALVEQFREEGLLVETIDSDNYDSGEVLEAAQKASLFGGQIIYLVDTPSADQDLNAEVINNFEALANSPHTFVVIEGPLLVDEKKRWGKYAEIEEIKSAATPRFNTFALADALARRDRKSLWLIWNEARLSGIAPEELVGILWWQFKSLRLAALTNSAEEAGMKDYPYQKAKRALIKFKTEEAETLSHSLLDTYHQSRLGGLDLDLAVERWLLRV
ncbi:hypothetical protein A2837_03115 [Candidatus Kaiserbacteria bacterium RIFCSPHIGHO2_01_FULL_46_22]|uniref:DNA-directed DNA polymerase n=1 Tax=Candidatus Kaiserbacteria bacterium RIFCSPHIGHO2_01_FULL_46_22 TaxID=1798475 RepID=A0A1F6BXB9_9BACT|nr:MAG: hypothetical protein A2837_03115 [Candidatus Kaiserbacteria bacterium RIFCSPHIGHO2_01_FULL_46_22]